MGLYINPPNETKEEFLAREGTHTIPKMPDDPKMCLVCLVWNVAFSAAGVCFDDREFQQFKYADGRSRCWYLVPIEKLSGVCPAGLLNRLFPQKTPTG